jgi:hypothetical protein
MHCIYHVLYMLSVHFVIYVLCNICQFYMLTSCIWALSNKILKSWKNLCKERFLLALQSCSHYRPPPKAVRAWGSDHTYTKTHRNKTVNYDVDKIKYCIGTSKQNQCLNIKKQAVHNTVGYKYISLHILWLTYTYNLTVVTVSPVTFGDMALWRWGTRIWSGGFR